MRIAVLFGPFWTFFVGYTVLSVPVLGALGHTSSPEMDYVQYPTSLKKSGVKKFGSTFWTKHKEIVIFTLKTA